MLQFVMMHKVIHACQEWSIKQWHHCIRKCQHSAWHFSFWGIISEISISNSRRKENSLDIIWLDFIACLNLIWKPDLFDPIQMVLSISKLLCLWHIMMLLFRYIFYTLCMIKLNVNEILKTNEIRRKYIWM